MRAGCWRRRGGVGRFFERLELPRRFLMAAIGIPLTAAAALGAETFPSSALNPRHSPRPSRTTHPAAWPPIPKLLPVSLTLPLLVRNSLAASFAGGRSPKDPLPCDSPTSNTLPPLHHVSGSAALSRWPSSAWWSACRCAETTMRCSTCPPVTLGWFSLLDAYINVPHAGSPCCVPCELPEQRSASSLMLTVLGLTALPAAQGFVVPLAPCPGT